LVGLITTDGCLSSDGRHIDITSNNYEFLEGIKNLTGLSNKIGVKYGAKKKKAFRIQIANKNFYDFLLSIGLMPNKSLVIRNIDVPKMYFVDFLRGLIDGDGCIRGWIHPSNKKEQWSLRIYSPSLPFMEWLQKSVERIFRVRGRIHLNQRKKPNAALFVLKYGKVAAKVILNRCYYKNALTLDRKARLARKCCLSYIGWKQSKIVLN
jgi:intein/homing endonuclease